MKYLSPEELHSLLHLASARDKQTKVALAVTQDFQGCHHIAFLEFFIDLKNRGFIKIKNIYLDYQQYVEDAFMIKYFALLQANEVQRAEKLTREFDYDYLTSIVRGKARHLEDLLSFFKKKSSNHAFCVDLYFSVGFVVETSSIHIEKIRSYIDEYLEKFMNDELEGKEEKHERIRASARLMQFMRNLKILLQTRPPKYLILGPLSCKEFTDKKFPFMEAALILHNQKIFKIRERHGPYSLVVDVDEEKLDACLVDSKEEFVKAGKDDKDIEYQYDYIEYDPAHGTFFYRNKETPFHALRSTNIIYGILSIAFDKDNEIRRISVQTLIANGINVNKLGSSFRSLRRTLRKKLDAQDDVPSDLLKSPFFEREYQEVIIARGLRKKRG